MQNILITGASSGIGKALKQHYESKGDRVINISLSDADYNCDVSKKEQLEPAFKAIKEKYGKIDIIINCAGFGLSGAIELIPIEKVQKIYDVNVIGTINCIQLVLPLMSERGKIINISSACAIFPLPYRAYYCSSKAAVSMLSDCLRCELAHTKIQSTAICPCDIKTEFTKNRIKSFETNERYGRSIELSTQKIDDAQDTRMPLEKAIKIFTKIIDKKHLRPEYVMGTRNKIMAKIQNVFPKSWVLKVLNKIFLAKDKSIKNK